jgi:hypothetical protein
VLLSAELVDDAEEAVEVDESEEEEEEEVVEDSDGVGDEVRM